MPLCTSSRRQQSLRSHRNSSALLELCLKQCSCTGTGFTSLNRTVVERFASSERFHSVLVKNVAGGAFTQLFRIGEVRLARQCSHSVAIDCHCVSVLSVGQFTAVVT